ncbi:hypothetical protein CKAH01_03448 [Colletotrichum kahawae]|uniref:Uncharacterized protein n=1 Tax=Colletotrichum kahawae TaxID=34407 RepID=A0AAD9YPY0_COLKA|nr:hypothetical protein CKAH01_03448 [Colletotrichum kahawae]
MASNDVASAASSREPGNLGWRWQTKSREIHTAGRYGLNGSFVIYANLKKTGGCLTPSTSKSDVPVATFQFGGCETPDELIAIHAVGKGALVNLGHGRRVNSAS